MCGGVTLRKKPQVFPPWGNGASPGDTTIPGWLQEDQSLGAKNATLGFIRIG